MRRLGGLKMVVVVVTVLFVIFHFTLGWSWRQTLLVPEMLLVLFLALPAYEFVIGKRRWDGKAPGGAIKAEAAATVAKEDGQDSKPAAS